MPLLEDQLYTCPSCDTKFMSKTLAGYNTFGNNYSDLYTGSSDEPQPILHKIHICPKCGFAAFAIDYRNCDFDLDAVKGAIEWTENFSKTSRENFTAGEGYLVISHYLPVSKEQKSFLKMQSCYAYRELQQPEKLQKTRKLVLGTIKEILKTQSYNENPKELYFYLAGELSRLLGDKTSATKYYKEALELSEKDSFVERITAHQLAHPKEILPVEIFRPGRK